MPTFFERMRELEEMEPELEIDNMETIKKYHDCICGMLDILKNNPALMLIAQQAGLYEQLLEKLNDTEEILNQYHHYQISNKQN
jgi:hypothetical protein